MAKLRPFLGRPPVKDRFVVQPQLGQFSTALNQDIPVSEGASHNFLYTACPDLKLMRFLRPERIACEQFNQVQALRNTPHVELHRRLLIPAARRRIQAHGPDAKRVANHLHHGGVVSPLTETKFRCGPRLPAWVLRVPVLNQHKRAFAVYEAGEPMAKGRIYGTEHK
jgi:hypothetical protein